MRREVANDINNINLTATHAHTISVLFFYLEVLRDSASDASDSKKKERDNHLMP